MNLGTSLPPGLSLGADGTIAGTPTTSGTYSFNIRAIDANGVSGSPGYNVAIAAATLAIPPAAPPGGPVDPAQRQAPTPSACTDPYHQPATAGPLPPTFAQQQALR